MQTYELIKAFEFGCYSIGAFLCFILGMKAIAELFIILTKPKANIKNNKFINNTLQDKKVLYNQKGQSYSIDDYNLNPVGGFKPSEDHDGKNFRKLLKRRPT